MVVIVVGAGCGTTRNLVSMIWHMALIVHIRPDGTLALDPRGQLPDSHPIPSSTLEAWGVTPGKPVTFTTDDGDVTYMFAGFGTKVSKGEEVADHKVLIYERQAE